ncbi:Possible protein kinase/ transcriptional regulator, LuxR family protein [Alloactinosynnema sp. L-07]|uniref:helix-turn-helix transcriptional regulator n=1 Tax=Alloactinosynnema sp. L-07 TaxID=1653480 RepID=UPI00065EF4C2|nr:LuxR C-terminal-related transcriptional regulator [Alloactinosynnema sp. L-07]CRK58503.1 Possible protein kinase/ transcriptional regulator, LuxR family protein [Alloactinosynnema sp. L-07]
MPSAAAERSPISRLPVEVTTYVGRTTEILEVKRLLGVAPLVTLTGPGGVGKTRLALRVATAERAAFADDVVFVSLAELREPKLLINTVADRLGLGDRGTRTVADLVVDHLRTRRLLLVLDNCEHLVEACARFIDTVLTSCPEVVVLATSRQSLGVAGEHVLPVPPLAIPEFGESSEALVRYDSVRMFLDRATAVVPSFTITDEHVDDVIRLCRALDGLPLAIELAAVRLRSLSPRQLADRLNKRFTLLTQATRSAPSRHETLQALIDWSHQLCTDEERMLWARASVFSGSFDLDAAESVCCGDDLPRDELLDVLDGLIDKSILLREENQGHVRYRMLETVRQYAEDRLRADGDLDRLRRRLRDWCLEQTTGFADNYVGPDQLDWVLRINREHANLRQALDFCLADPVEAALGLRMVTAVTEFWIMRGLMTEGRIWYASLTELVAADDPVRPAAAWRAAFLALVQGDMTAYESLLATATEVAERFDDDSARAYVRHVRAYAALMGNEGARSAELFQSAAETFSKQGDLGGELWSTYNSGLAIALTGDLDGARVVLRDTIDRYTELGEKSWRSWALWSLCAAEYLHGQYEAAQDAGLEVLRLQRQVGHQAVMAFALHLLAGCATHLGEYQRAARLLGGATTIWQLVGASPGSYAAFHEPMQRDILLVTGALGNDRAAAEFMAGAAMSTDESVAYALREGDKEQAPARTAPLTKREMEVAILVAKGMTNREIAKALVISLRTAETHVDHIRTKLGSNNRAQIAAWVVAQ